MESGVRRQGEEATNSVSKHLNQETYQKSKKCSSNSAALGFLHVESVSLHAGNLPSHTHNGRRHESAASAALASHPQPSDCESNTLQVSISGSSCVPRDSQNRVPPCTMFTGEIHHDQATHSSANRLHARFRKGHRWQNIRSSFRHRVSGREVDCLVNRGIWQQITCQQQYSPERLGLAELPRIPGSSTNTNLQMC